MAAFAWNQWQLSVEYAATSWRMDETYIKVKGKCVSANKFPYLRRWDHSKGNEEGVPIVGDWLALEDGIQIQFPESNDAIYQSGDYWLIPARTATGDIEWPKDKTGESKDMLPHGVFHHYAPLAVIDVKASGEIHESSDLRRKLIRIWKNAG